MHLGILSIIETEAGTEYWILDVYDFSSVLGDYGIDFFHREREGDRAVGRF